MHPPRLSLSKRSTTVRSMSVENPEAASGIVTSQEHPSFIAVDYTEVASVQVEFLAMALRLSPSNGLLKVNPDFNTKLTINGSRRKYQDVVGSTHASFCSSFLDPHAVDAKIFHLSLDVVKFTTMSLGPSRE